MRWIPPAPGREPLSWASVAAWTALIYLTIPFARAIQQYAQARNARMWFLWGTWLVFAAAAAGILRAWRRHLWRPTPAQGLILGIVLSLFFWQAWTLRANPEEAFHYVQYGILGLLLFRALSHRLADPSIYPAAALCGAAIGIGDELIQWLSPDRFFDYRDIGINALAGVLTQIGLWGGIRPAYIRRPFSLRGLRLVAAALAGNTLLLLFCVNNTPAFLDAAARLFPPLAAVNEVTAEYGHRLATASGTSFFSRLTAAELRRQDRENAPEAAALISAFPTDREYAEFLRRHPPHRAPFPAEARIRIFRRDRHAANARRLPPGPERETAAEIACREEEILSEYFPRTLALSVFRWPEAYAVTIQSFRGAPWPAYVSPVSQGMITRLSQGALNLCLLVLLGASVAVWGWTSRALQETLPS